MDSSILRLYFDFKLILIFSYIQVGRYTSIVKIAHLKDGEVIIAFCDLLQS